MSNKIDIFQQLFCAFCENNAEDRCFKIIKDYLDSGGSISITNPANGWGLLHYASENLFISIIKMLLERGALVNFTDINGSTPYLVALDAAIDFSIQENLRDIDFTAIKVLINHGADINVISMDGISKDLILNNYGENAIAQYNKFFS